MVWFSFRPKEEVAEEEVRMFFMPFACALELDKSQKVFFLLKVNLPQLYSPFIL